MFSQITGDTSYLQCKSRTQNVLRLIMLRKRYGEQFY